MDQLAQKRRAIRKLLDEHKPADAMAVHYAFYHPENRTQIITQPADAGAGEATGYVALSRTGIDLFRPLVTLRLPISDMEASVNLIYTALPPGASVILSAPSRYSPLLQALFEIQTEEQLRLFTLDRRRFEPIINVLVTTEESHNALPRFVVRHSEGDTTEVVASAGLNWQTPRFADIVVHADQRYRRRGWGRSVVAALVQHLLNEGRAPLYVVSEQNVSSMRLAESVGFADSGERKVLIQGTLKPRP